MKKRCIDCRHCTIMSDEWGGFDYFCQNGPIRLVTGKAITIKCDDARVKGGHCGNDGSKFEAHPPKPKKARESIVSRWLKGKQ